MTDKTIFIFDAQEGDKLADDVHTPDGNILAKKDTILNYDIIANISGHHILEVKVYDTNNELQDLEKNPEIIMPTQNVYFFVEKIPIDYAGSTNHKEVTVEGAEASLPSAGGIEPYFAENRWYTMCHIYYWTQKFKELYPDEMEVYYETDSFICYRVQQNVNSPYNFAIDYGYNNPTPKAGSEEE